MGFLVPAALSNAVIVSVLAPIALAVDRLSRRPALAHRLWLLLLIKLITPPLMPISLPGPIHSPPPQPATPAAPPADQSRSRWESIGDGPAAPKVGRPPPGRFDRETSGPPSRISGLARTTAWHVTLRWGLALAGL